MKMFFLSCMLFIALVSNLFGYADSLNLVPLTELGTGLYQTYQGGLYPDGLNERPVLHNEAGINISQSMMPLDTNGNVDSLKGKFVLLSIGMSNATQEFSTFKPMADTMKNKNQNLLIIDGAQGGQTASIIQNPDANFWSVVNQRLSVAKSSPKQVQIVWLKEADANPKNDFPIHAQTLTTELKKVCQILKSKFPNSKFCYFSSRIYGGYASSTLNPEPMAYESGLSIKWLIESQINGDTSLIYNGTNPRSPWLSWGPYTWANGKKPREDGLIWVNEDFVQDGTHPSNSGRQKVANMLIDFFQTDETAKSWFLKKTTSDIPVYSENFQFEIYPNPANDNVSVNYFSTSNNETIVNIINIIGITVIEKKFHIVSGNNLIKLDTKELPSGQYLCCFRSNNSSLTRKFLVIK